MTSSSKIKSNDERHKGLKTDFYVENGVYKYTYGNSEDYDEILKLKKSIADKFKDAFIIAFLNGKKINTREAIEMFKKQKK
jgi:N-acetylmuramoyl-L-alanine amidase